MDLALDGSARLAGGRWDDGIEWPLARIRPSHHRMRNDSSEEASEPSPAPHSLPLMPWVGTWPLGPGAARPPRSSRPPSAQRTQARPRKGWDETAAARQCTRIRSFLNAHENTHTADRRIECARGVGRVGALIGRLPWGHHWLHGIAPLNPSNHPTRIHTHHTTGERSHAATKYAVRGHAGHAPVLLLARR